MKRVMIVVLVLLMASPLFAQQKSFLDQPYIEVTGRAEMEVMPDEIYVTITIDEQSVKGKIPVLQQEKNMVARLQSLGIDVEKQLVVLKMVNDLGKRNEVVTSKRYSLVVHSATQLAHVFQALKSIDIVDAYVDRTDISNYNELRQQVRGEAAKVARQNAELLAASLEQKIGKAVYIQDVSDKASSAQYYSNTLVSAFEGLVPGVQASAAPSLEFQKIKIDHSVLVRFLLE